MLFSKLLRHQSDLGLSCVQLALALNFSDYWRAKAEKRAEPLNTYVLSQRLGITIKEVVSAIRDLEAKGYARPVIDPTSDSPIEYDMTGLIHMLNATTIEVGNVSH